MDPSSGAGLVFGCVPHVDDVAVRGKLNEVCDALALLAGVKVRSHRSPSPAALAGAFAAGRVDLAWVSPTLFLSSDAFRYAAPLVSSVREGSTLFHAVLFVAADSAIRSPTEIRGKRVAWVAPTSASGYIVPRLALARYGLEPRGLFSRETFFDSHGAVARAVLEGSADVGATYAVFEDGDATKTLVRAGFEHAPPLGARIIHAAGPIPSDLVVAARSVPIVTRAALVLAFEHLHTHARGPMLSLFGADAFTTFVPGALDSLREEVEAGVALGLLDR